MAIYVGGTVLLLHGDGADASTVFTDETGKAVTAYGNAKISTAQSKFGGASMYFDGDGDYLTVPGAGFAFGVDNFTLEAWVYLPVVPSGSFAAVVDIRNTDVGSGAVLWMVDSNRTLGYYGATTLRTTAAIALNQWVHVALCRGNGVLRLFIDGVLGASVADTNSIVAPPLAFVGGVFNNGHPAFNGYIDDLRITKGLALYTANFTPPVAPLEVQGIYANVQAQNPGLHKLAKFDPSLSKPAMQSRADNLQNRMPYGPWKTPNVVWEFIGRGIVTGTVAEKSTPANTPLHRLVRLHREPDGLFVKATWSDPVTGAYTFTGVRADRKYFVTSFDYTGTYRAVIADNLTPELLP